MHRLLAALACLCLAPTATLAAGAYPDHSITIVVSSPAGSTPDTGTRAIAQSMARSLGQPVVVENRPGANGQIAAQEVLKNPPDGYTILVAAGSTMAINPHIYPHQAVDILKDLTAVGKIYSTDFFLIVRSNSGINTMADLVAKAKQKPGALVAANSGPGSAAQLATEVLKEKTGTDIYQVPFNGSPAAALGVAAGNADMLIETQAVTEPFVASGKVRRLATTGSERNPAYPDVPTMAQAGIAGMEISSWAGIFARTQVPKDRIDRINAAMNQALTEPEVRKVLQGAGLAPGGGTSAAFQEEWQAQSRLWAEVVARTPGLTNR
ncbi:tripartite tricarboxylate transporter substrate binding protein [Bordetella sp. LUAb4]|uniref:Bug family tripartite tricarboxylate transporter substrate binding protein n=1 Tax=Bordetella sp. LUAb4 TaxID=2843195 RepID=UPI001E5D76CD|nr:tripartite tricarboxylate transporter substrate binding protein [Bordetella sp. LUAb4]